MDLGLRGKVALGAASSGGIGLEIARSLAKVPQNVDTSIGNLGLTNEREDQLVAFLMTLTDGYKPPQAHKASG